MKNYYKILGVDKNASSEQIKKAYRNKSKQYHPDVNPHGADMFKDVVEAYDVLTDKNKKAKYDNPNPLSDFENMFGSMFTEQRRQPKSPDKIINFNITPIESFKGVVKNLTYSRNTSCDGCSGTGGSKKTCTRCGGNGIIITQVGTTFFATTKEIICPTCNGGGYEITNECNVCNGYSVKRETNTIDVNVPKGVDNGDFLRVHQQGDYYVNGSFGDLVVKIVVNRSDDFEKMSDDLIYYKELTPINLLLDDKFNVPHPDGDIMINLPENLNTEKPLRVRSKGFVTRNGIGNLYIKVVIKNEIKLTDNQKEEFKKLIQ